jgi:hypothetical protein
LLLFYWTFANFDLRARNHRYTRIYTDEEQEIIKNFGKNLCASVKICGSGPLRLKRRNSNILDIAEHTGNTIIVNIQSVRGKKYDETVRLEPGDHDFIKRESYINYRLARIVSLSDLQALIDNGVAKIMTPMEEEVISRICDGINRSPFSPREVKEMYTDHIYRNRM